MYNFISEDDILLKWKVNDPKIDTIYINDYKLKWFRSGDGEFIYRLKQNWFNTIKEGKNTYKIIFERSWKIEYSKGRQYTANIWHYPWDDWDDQWPFC